MWGIKELAAAALTKLPPLPLLLTSRRHFLRPSGLLTYATDIQ
jgi:hypothetical protein